MNDMEVIIASARDGKQELDALCLVGYLPVEGYESIMLGTYSEVAFLVKNGKLEKPKGYIEPHNFPDDNDPSLV